MEVRKSILIIKANPKGLGGVETFLKNRGWVLFSTTDMKEGFSYLVKNKPSIVMVAVDHPVKKIRTLPRLLAQAYPVCIMAFVESTSTHSYKLLMDSGVEYKINPPATGPAVERAVNKFIKDQQVNSDLAQARSDKDILDKANAEKASSEVLSGSEPLNSKNNEVFSFQSKGTGSEKFEKSVVTGGKRANVVDANQLSVEAQTPDVLSSLLNRMSDGDNYDEALVVQALSLAQGPAYRPDHSEARPVGSVYYPDQKPNKGLSPQYHEEDLKGKDFGSVRTSEAVGSDLSARQKNSSGDLMSAENSEEQGKNLSAEVKAKKAKNLEAQNKSGLGGEFADATLGNQGPGSLMKTNPSAERSRDVSSPEVGEPMDITPGNLHKKIRTVNENHRDPNERESLLARGADKALNDSVIFGDGTIKEKLQANTQVACIVVESPRFSGYLVAAMGKNRKIDQEFMNLIRQRLSRFLKEQGEEIKEEESININIQEVDFEGWAIEYGDFLRKSIHKGDELAIAFFPFAKKKNELGPSAVAEMGSLKMEDLQGDIQVEFNLYIYLATNNRYVLYTPRGSVFYGGQKERLAKRGVTHLHMRRSEAQDLSKYRAQNYLNAKIAEYSQKKGLKKSA